MKLKTFVFLVALAALLVVVLAPSAMAAGTGVTMKLTGPSNAAYGSMIPLKVVIKNSLKYGGGNRVTIVLQNKNGDLKRIGSKTIWWTMGGSKGYATLWVKAYPSAMGIAKYRAAWRNPGGSTHSNMLSVEID